MTRFIGFIALQSDKEWTLHKAMWDWKMDDDVDDDSAKEN